MRTTKEITIPAKQELRTICVICELCNKEIDNELYDADEVEISHRTGTTHDHYGAVTDVSVDMCGKCFDEKLLPWLQEQGATLNTNHGAW